MKMQPPAVPVWNRERGGALGLLVVAAVSLVWRLPSLFDPPWVNDEGTYFAIAQAMAHGYGLYRDVWENKPPGIYLLYSAVYHPFGSSLIGVRVVGAACVLLLVLLVFGIARTYVEYSAALAGALLAGMLMGVPFLEGTTANAEVFLTALAALGVYLSVVRGWAGASGVAMGLAILFKVVAAFDATALGLWLVFHMRDHRRGGTGPWWSAGGSDATVTRSSLVLYALGVAGALTLAVAWSWSSGILNPMVRDAVLYDLGYVGHGNGGAFPWLLAVKIAVLLGFAFGLRYSRFPWLWLVFSVAGASVSGRIFGHYMLQAVAPASVCFALIVQRHRVPGRGLLIGLPCLFLGSGLLAAAIGWSLAATGNDSILARRLQYYANFARYVVGNESYGTYRGQIDDHVNRNIEIAARLKSLPAGRLLVWGNTPWVYVLSGRLPATPYTSALRTPEVPGETSQLRSSVRHDRPAELVVVFPPSPGLGSAARTIPRLYRPSRAVGNAVIYVRRGRR